MVSKVTRSPGADASGVYRRPRLVLRAKRFEEIPGILANSKTCPTPVRMVGACLDITEEKRAHEEQARLSQAVEHAAESVVITDPQWTIVYVNPAFERIYGYTSDEIIGRSGRSMTPEDHIGEGLAILEKIKAGENVENLETVCIRKDGSTFPVSLSVSPIRDAGGAVVGLSAIARDVQQKP